jgi:hypothetical protein
VRTRLAAPAALLALLALAGCGSGTSASSSAAATRTSSPSAGDAPTATSGPTTTGTSTASTTSAATLARTKGYATYEACRGTCTGSIPASVRRSLHLPAQDAGPCPITIHVAGPVGPRQLSAGVGFHSVPASSWLGAQVTWIAAGTYTGPVLIRGGQIGGGALGFGTGARPYDELQLLDAGRGAPRVAANGRAWITYTRIPSAGCYAYQVDGTSFSEIVVFRAVG